MRLLFTFARSYALQSALMMIALLFAGIAEGISLSTLLPLLSAAATLQAGSGQGPAADGSGLERAVVQVFSSLGISPTIEILLLVIVAGIVVKNLLVLAANRQVGYTVARVATDLRLKLLHALLVTRWEHHLGKPVGSFANSMATEALRASKAYLSGAMMTSFVIEAVVYAIVALLVSWKAVLGALVFGLVLMYPLNRFVIRARRAGERQTKLLKSLLSHLTDALQSIKPLKSMARENLADAVLEKKTKGLNKALQKQVMAREGLKAFQEPMLTVFLAIGLYLAVVDWRIPLTTVIMLVLLLSKLLKDINKIQREYQQMVIFESAYWSLDEAIQGAEKDRETALGSRVPTLNKGIRIDRVSFAYGEHRVLREASLHFPAGSFTALVGPSGSGKTTVADLVTALLRPQKGEIWLDELPLSEIHIPSWRRMIGYVPQETMLLHDTVLNNVTLGAHDLKREDAEDALRAAGAWEFISAMPKGMDAIVGERGGKLSGGQRQRIAIARALVHRPKLLILDEATSALDRDSEMAICETLGQLRGELTILAISHQPAFMTAADRTYKLQDGEIVLIEKGSADQMDSEELSGLPETVSDPVLGRETAR